MSKVEKVRMFNQILESMIIQLSPIIGTTYHYKLMQIIGVNAILPIKEFILQAIPYKDKILNRDESYFSKPEVTNNLIDVQKEDIGDILKLQDIFFKLDKNSRTNIWDIFQALLILGCEYNDM